MKTVIFCLCLVLTFALQASGKGSAAAKKHPPGSPARECSECHAAQAQVWERGAHGLMRVNCVVCHGSPEKNFRLKPEAARCRGCHAEQVDDLKRIPAKDRTCFLCHESHSAAVKENARSRAGFHQQGGDQ